MPSEQSLRERKKLATRAAMSRAAWSLFIDHGIDAVTPEAVAEAVDVSPRTFRNYFSSREEAIVDGIVQRSGALVEALRTRPVDEPVWDSLEQVLPDTTTTVVPDRDKLVVLMRLRRENPAFMAQYHAVFERRGRLLAETIADRTGTDVDRDLAPRLLAATVTTAVETSIALWAEGRTDRTLPDLVRESLTQLRAGIPPGGAAPTA